MNTFYYTLDDHSNYLITNYRIRVPEQFSLVLPEHPDMNQYRNVSFSNSSCRSYVIKEVVFDNRTRSWKPHLNYQVTFFVNFSFSNIAFFLNGRIWFTISIRCSSNWPRGQNWRCTTKLLIDFLTCNRSLKILNWLLIVYIKKSSANFQNFTIFLLQLS